MRSERTRTKRHERARGFDGSRRADETVRCATECAARMHESTIPVRFSPPATALSLERRECGRTISLLSRASSRRGTVPGQKVEKLSHSGLRLCAKRRVPRDDTERVRSRSRTVEIIARLVVVHVRRVVFPEDVCTRRRHKLYRRRKSKKREWYRDVETQRATARVHDVDERANVENIRVRIARARRLARGVEPTARIRTARARARLV